MSRTINPLHFEDLEPKRFEDLIRQLVYDYKFWAEIEATGRSGSDGGFDVRAWEKIPIVDEDEEAPKDRKWLIQCKREQQIGPTKARKYAKDIVKANPDLYGILFVASCNLSKDARDAIREELATAGVQEAHIWSRSEIEDQLFQPKNDHLLFGYFGFSLVRRRQSAKTKIRAKLVTKKKLKRTLGDNPHGPVMIRDTNFEDYPDLSAYEGKKTDDSPAIITSMYGTYYDGLVILIKRFHAYVDKDKKEYDFDPRYNQALHYPSVFKADDNDAPKDRMAFLDFHRNLPENKRSYYLELGYIPYEAVLDVDEMGDEYFDRPHIYVQRSLSGKLYARPYLPSIHSDSNFTRARPFNAGKFKRIKIFPKTYRSKKPPKSPETSPTQQPPSEEPFSGLNSNN